MSEDYFNTMWYYFYDCCTKYPCYERTDYTESLHTKYQNNCSGLFINNQIDYLEYREDVMATDETRF